MLQDVDAFMSRHDIESGARWAERIQQELEQSSYGLILLTRSNLDAKWLLFEAGAISKLKNSSTACLLCGELMETEVTGPLAQFQFQKFEKASFFQLVRDMNNRLARPLQEIALGLVLEKWWPDIESEYGKIIEQHAVLESEEKNPRNEREFQDEILRMLQIAVKPKSTFAPKRTPFEVFEKFELIWADLSVEEVEFLMSVTGARFTRDSLGKERLINRLMERGLLFSYGDNGPVRLRNDFNEFIEMKKQFRDGD